MHLLWPFLFAALVLAVVLYYANSADIIQPIKSILMVILVLLMAIVLLRFVGVNIPFGMVVALR